MSTTTHAGVAGEIVAVTVATTARDGRFIVSARHHHFVSDGRAATGAPGEAIQAGELLLASLASCGLALIQRAARERGIDLPRADVRVAFERDPDDVTRYRYIALEAALPGVAPETGAALLHAFTSTCPIYNTLRRGGNVTAALAPAIAADRVPLPI